MIILKLNNFGETLLDKEDYEWVSSVTWRQSSRGYAVRQFREGKKRINLYLHRALIIPPPDMFIDHINGNPLDNRKTNLRVCSHGQNMANRKFTKNDTKYKCVYRSGKKFKAFCQGRYLGTFDTKEDAAHAYNKRAMVVFKEFALLNEVK